MYWDKARPSSESGGWGRGGGCQANYYKLHILWYIPYPYRMKF